MQTKLDKGGDAENLKSRRNLKRKIMKSIEQETGLTREDLVEILGGSSVIDATNKNSSSVDDFSKDLTKEQYTLACDAIG